MEADYDYYKIDIADIWQFEQLQFINGKSSEEFVRDLFPRIEDFIIINGAPSFTTEDYDKGDGAYRRTFTTLFEDFRDTFGDFKSRYSLNYFFTNDYCFFYDKRIIPDYKYDDFDFWFVLKLRQYDSKLSRIKSFLDFQLKTNFRNETREFVDFLTICIRQYQDQYLENKVIKTVNDWVEIKLKLRENNEIDKKLILKINYNHLELFDILKPYIKEEDFGKMNKLLRGEEVQGKIYFGSNANLLVMIFRQLHIHQSIIGSKKNTSKWICQYFTYLNGTMISNFDDENVYKILTVSHYDIRDSERIDIPGLEYVVDKSIKN